MAEIMYVVVTENCNLECPFCYIEQKPSELPFDLAIKTIDKYKPDNLIFHGGEPLLKPELISKIRNHYADKNASITSNLTLPMTEARMQAIKDCYYLATSYSYDRFLGKDKEYELWKHNIELVKKENIPLRLLVTLSLPQLERPPEELAAIINEINPSNGVLLERLFLDEEPIDLPERTDDYLIKISKLIPYDINVLAKTIVSSIKHDQPVFDITCKERTRTLKPDGRIQTCCSIPKLSRAHVSQRYECISCEYYRYCKGDCLQYKERCKFPKKFFDWIRKENIE